WPYVSSKWISRVLTKVSIAVESAGTAVRDFIFVDDIVSGLMRCALHGVPGAAYKLATGEETTIINLAKLINELTGNPTPVQFLPKRAWDNSGKRFGSTAKAERVLGFKASVPIREGLEKTVAWTRENLP